MLNIEGSEELAGLESPQFDGVVGGSASEESIVKRKC
jgi:hypothetical protein